MYMNIVKSNFMTRAVALFIIMSGCFVASAYNWAKGQLFYDIKVGEFGYICEYRVEKTDDGYKSTPIGLILTRYFGNQQNVIIPESVIVPSSGEELEVISIRGVRPVCESPTRPEYYNYWHTYGFEGDDASPFGDSPNVRSVVLPHGLKSIYNKAFYQCLNLRTVEMNDSLNSIGESAFEGCRSLNSLHIADYVEQISQYAFKDCVSLSKIDMSNCKIKSLSSLFVGCSTLSEVILPPELEQLYKTFSDCVSLRKVELPVSMKIIGNESFAGCVSLVEINFPEYLTVICKDAFNNCIGLNEVHFADNLTQLGGFANCIGLTKVDVPESVELIDEDAFKNCLNLSGVNLSENLQSIGKSAFENCYLLNQVILPAGLKALGSRSFLGTGLEEIDIPDQITEIPDGCFSFTKLRNIELPDGIVTLGSRSFSDCEQLETANLNDSLRIIGDEVFSRCAKLSLVNLPSDLKLIGNYAFDGTPNLNLASEYFPMGLTEIGDGAFCGSGIGKIVFGAYVSSIGDDCFAGCGNLKSVEIRSDPAIGHSAFGECYVTTEEGSSMVKTNLDYFICLVPRLRSYPTTAEIFTDETFCDCVLYLSDYDLENKLSQYPWKLFQHVVVSDWSGIRDVYLSDHEGESGSQIYTLDGTKVSSGINRSAIYIVNGKKVVEH